MRRRGSASASSREAGSIHSRAIPASTTLAGQPSVSASSLLTKSSSCCRPDRWCSTSAVWAASNRRRSCATRATPPARRSFSRRKGRLVSGENDEVDRLGAVLEKVAEHLVHAGRVHGLVIVVEDDVAGSLEKPVALGTELGGEYLGCDVEDRAGLELSQECRAEPGVQPAHGAGHGREKGQGVVVEDVELVPDRRSALESGCGGRGLAVARGRADDGEPPVECGRECRARLWTQAYVVEAGPEILRLDRHLYGSLVRHSRPRESHRPRQGRLL